MNLYPPHPPPSQQVAGNVKPGNGGVGGGGTLAIYYKLLRPLNCTITIVYAVVRNNIMYEYKLQYPFGFTKLSETVRKIILYLNEYMYYTGLL